MSDMTSREIVRRTVAHTGAPRHAWNFSDPRYNDISGAPLVRHMPEPPDPCDAWGRHEELIALTGFGGEVRRDRYGNIYGRFNGRTKGECIRGCIVDWEKDFESYCMRMPVPDPAHRETLLKLNLPAADKYILCGFGSIFSALRDARLIANALADTLLEPEYVTAFLDRVADYLCDVLKIAAGTGIDAVMLGDDWGTQEHTFISPGSFASLFAPAYKRVCDTAHNAGMSVFMHSCGKIYEFIPLLIDAGVDVFQFDQPDVYPSERLASEFGNRVCFHCPVDIQRVMPTGDLGFITRRAREMCDIFRASCSGGIIFKDYPSWHDIGVDEAWATAARDAVVANSLL